MPYIILSILLAVCSSLKAQNSPASSVDSDDVASPTFVPMVKVGKTLVGSDSIQYVELNNIFVYPKPTFKNKRQRQAYNRLVRNVKTVLPLAKEVRSTVVETYEYLQTLPTKEERDKHIQFMEKELRREYTPRMKKLTFAQGKLLIKLIYRESNSSTYQLINAFLGPTRANVYQGVAWFFGASLTKKYDAAGVDRITERIVRQVEAGQL